MSAMPDFPRPPFPEQRQSLPGRTAEMDPKPDHGESSYKGSGYVMLATDEASYISGAMVALTGGKPII